MKIDNKGMGIIEVLVSISLITIILALLFALLVQVNEEDNENNIQSMFLINQASFIKMLEEDIVDYGVSSVTNCSLNELNIQSETLNHGYEENFKCLKINYAANYLKENIGFLVVYNYYTRYKVENGVYKGRDPAWVIQYSRGYYQEYNKATGSPIYSSWKSAVSQMRSVPDEVDLSEKSYIIYTAAYSSNGGVKIYNAASIVVPIVDSRGLHYDINLGFTFVGNDNFKCISKDSSFCKCQSNDDLCNKTYQ